MPGVKGQVQQRGVERRQQIIDAAIELFATNGFRGTGLAAVADAVGITPGAILHHFGSKERLLEAVIEERDSRTSARLVSLASLGGADALRSMVHVAEEVERDRRLASLYTVLEVENLEHDDLVHDFFVRRSRVVRRLLSDILRVGVEQGEFRADSDIPALVAEAIAFMEGAQLIWLLDPGSSSLSAMYRTYFGRLVESISPS